MPFIIRIRNFEKRGAKGTNRLGLKLGRSKITRMSASEIETLKSRLKKKTATSYSPTSYDVLDVSEFRHHRINHSERFVEGKTNHINGIENFWNQAKRHMRRFNGIPKDQFPLFLKECEWRFNYRPTENLYKVLLKWAKQDLL